MQSSKKEGKRKFFDVHASGQRPHFTVHGRNVVNLRPKFFVRRPWISAAVFLVILVIIFFGIRQLSTRAEVQDFFPTTCLGNWQDVAAAQGTPETLNSSSSSFSAANSAVYASGTEIYCGGFVSPSFATSGAITNVGLTLMWQIGNTPVPSGVIATSSDSDVVSTSTISATSTASSTEIIPSSTATSSDVVATTTVATTTTTTATDVISTSSTDSTDASATVDTSDDQAIAPTSTPTPPAPSSTPDQTPTQDQTTDASSTSFIRQLIPFAFADDTSSGTVAGTTGTTATTTIATSTDDVGTTTTGASGTDASGTLVVAPPPVPDENFLDVSYSTDGQTWISIGQVSLSNWQQFTVTLPISDWADLQNLQIRVEGIPTTQDPVPPVYLDGMFVEVDYTVPPSIPSLTQPSVQSSSAEQVIQISPNVTITVPPPQAVTSTVPAPTITAITKTTNQVSVTLQYVGDFYDGNPLYLFVYPDGTAADRNDADSAFTFAGTPTEGPSINARELTSNLFDPTTDQATVTIVEPVTPDDSEIATGAMATGTYDVDVSYFDGEVWHLIPAQTFTWP